MFVYLFLFRITYIGCIMSYDKTVGTLFIFILIKDLPTTIINKSNFQRHHYHFILVGIQKVST